MPASHLPLLLFHLSVAYVVARRGWPLMAIGQRERRWIVGGAEQDVRCDGRQRGDFRRVQIEMGVVPQASGSARVRVGGTEVLVGVHGTVGNTDADHPDRGQLRIGVEVSSLASAKFAGRGGEDLGAELTKSLERAMAASGAGQGGALDLRSLCLIPGKVAWTVYVDAVVLGYEGSLLDATSIAARAALLDTRLPRVQVMNGDKAEEMDIEVDDDPTHSVPLDASQAPIIVTVSQIGRCCVVDCTPEEEACSTGSLEVGVTAGGELCGVTMKGGSLVDPQQLAEMAEMGRRVGSRLMSAVTQYVLKTQG